MDNPRSWLVTGGAGFIGSHLVEALLAAGQWVRVLDDFSTGRKAVLHEVVHGVASDRFDLLEGDIRDPAVCKAACQGVDVVLHQAALGSVPRSLESPRVTHAVNVEGFVNIALAAREASVQRFVYASSSSVYGDSKALPQREACTGALLSPYAASKRVGELYAEIYHRSFGLPTVGLRYFNVVGPRQNPAGPYAAVVPRWVQALSSHESPVIYGDGLTSRDFCPVANVVQANLLAASASAQAYGQVFNIALGQSTTLLRLFEILKEGMAAAGVAPADIQPTFGAFRPGDLRHSQASIDKAQAVLGYAPVCTLEEGLREVIREAVAHTGGTTP